MLANSMNSWILFGLHEKYAYRKALQHIFNFFHNAKLGKSLDRQINAMARTMHTNHEWCILIFDLDCHTCFDTLKNIHLVNYKSD